MISSFSTFSYTDTRHRIFWPWKKKYHEILKHSAFLNSKILPLNVSCLYVCMYVHPRSAWTVERISSVICLWTKNMIVLAPHTPITGAPRSKACIFFARSNLGSWVRIPLYVWMSVCFYSVLVLGSGFCDGLIPRPRSPTDCPRIKKVKWNNAFHGCHMLQSGDNRKERERKRVPNIWACQMSLKRQNCDFLEKF
jgi:hypothetical protein